MRIMSVEQANAKRTRRSIMAYLEGEKNLNWIVGTINSSGDVMEAKRLYLGLSGYGDHKRYEELGTWFEMLARPSMLYGQGAL